MIGYLKGQVLEHADGRMVVVVGPGTGPAIGYLVNVPHGAEYGRFLPGGSVELHVYTHVREDQLELFGFASREEKELFLTLLSVNGIGPKGAMGILSGTEFSQLVSAVAEGDKAFLQKVPGVGKKTAERLVLELADTFRKKAAAGVFGKLAPSVSTALQAGAALGQAKASAAAESQELRDAREALTGLGYREQEVSAVLKKLLEGVDAPPRAEHLIRVALQRLS
jgi:Holliday junction DNA helicase RuvA